MGGEPTLHQTMHFRRLLQEPMSVWLLEDIVGEWRTWRDLVSEWQDLRTRHLPPPKPMRAMIVSLSSGNLSDAWTLRGWYPTLNVLALLANIPFPVLGISTMIG